MARKKRGQPIHGWLVIDKSLGITSTAVVNKVRWALNAQKAGHAGTLDPLATGVLAVALGEATKTVPIAQEGEKTYHFTIRLGQRTTTDDAEGALLETSPDRPTDEEIIEALESFTGDIQQVPPQFSAVKVDGERAYDLARDGVGMDLAPRPLHVSSLTLLDRPGPDHATLELVCGKGGYVRSIARDLGEALGCHAHVSALRRIASGSFRVDAALPFDRVEGYRGQPPPNLLPIEAGLADLPEVKVRPPDAVKLRNGNAAPVAYSDLQYGDQAWASVDGMPVALVTYKAGMLHPARVFVLD
ncbi:MAG: tRNA pseudouridine(55) synthase TruB [Pseudomonadota bacterium]